VPGRAAHSTRRRRSRRTAQALQAHGALAVLQRLPIGAQRGTGEVGEHAQAALLRVDEVRQVLLLLGAAAARGEQVRARRALLARGLLGLHQVQQRHQRAQNAGHAGQQAGVGQVREQLHQAGDARGVGGDGVLRAGLARLHGGALRGQRLQPQQHPGHAAEHGRIDLGVGLGVVRIGLALRGQQRGQARQRGRAGGDGIEPLLREALAARGQVDAAGAALVLQRVDALAQRIDQRDALAQAVRGLHLQPLGAQHQAAGGAGGGRRRAHARATSTRPPSTRTG